MSAVDQFFKMLRPDMGVNLRGRDVGMAEQRLQRPQVCAAFKQMRGECVAQHMR